MKVMRKIFIKHSGFFHFPDLSQPAMSHLSLAVELSRLGSPHLTQPSVEPAIWSPAQHSCPTRAPEA